MSNGNTLNDNTYLLLCNRAATSVQSMTEGAMRRGYEYSAEGSNISYELRLIEAEDALIDAIKQRRLMRRTTRG